MAIPFRMSKTFSALDLLLRYRKLCNTIFAFGCEVKFRKKDSKLVNMHDVWAVEGAFDVI